MPTLGDNPIEGPEDDELDRIDLARTIRSELQHLDAAQGFVVGVLGPWGSGKTSLINLVRHELGDAMPIVDFNPWMFSGAEQLVESFFNEIAAQLRDRSSRFSAIADDLQLYGEVLAPMRFLPVVGPWIERVRGGAGALKKLADNRRGGVAARRQLLSDKLREIETPVIVVVDDIDRLRTDEIRDVFKLVRLTANFPNLVYVLAFDRGRVEQALTEDGMPGRDYLEKILQLTFDVPPVAPQRLTRRLTQAIDHGLSDFDNPGKFHSDEWPDVLIEVVVPLVRNMRDVRRYVASLRGTVRHLRGQVALVDVLGLEAVRVFLPDVFDRLSEAREGLTKPWSGVYGGSPEPPELKDSVEGVIAAAADRADVARAMVMRLFPAGRRHIENMSFGPEWQKEWLRERRVAHSDVLSYYLQRVENDSLRAFAAAERAFDLLPDRAALDAYLRTLDLERLEDVVAALEAYEGEYPPGAVVPAAVVLLNWLPRMPERPRGMSMISTRLVVVRVVLRLVRTFTQPADVLTATRDSLALIETLSSKLELITIVGHQEGAGHRLVGQAAAASLERLLRDEVRAADGPTLAREKDLLRLVHWTKRTADPSEPPMALPADPEFAATLLKDAATETLSQSIGSRTVRRDPRLAWDSLVAVCGDERAVQQLVDLSRASAGDDDELREAVELATRYLSGWRPRDFGEE